jgi:hypothetical protein
MQRGNVAGRVSVDCASSCRCTHSPFFRICLDKVFSRANAPQATVRDHPEEVGRASTEEISIHRIISLILFFFLSSRCPSFAPPFLCSLVNELLFTFIVITSPVFLWISLTLHTSPQHHPRPPSKRRRTQIARLPAVTAARISLQELQIRKHKICRYDPNRHDRWPARTHFTLRPPLH